VFARPWFLGKFQPGWRERKKSRGKAGETGPFGAKHRHAKRETARGRFARPVQRPSATQIDAPFHGDWNLP
jgi:hypothetical protein